MSTGSTSPPTPPRRKNSAAAGGVNRMIPKSVLRIGVKLPELGLLTATARSTPDLTGLILMDNEDEAEEDLEDENDDDDAADHDLSDEANEVERRNQNVKLDRSSDNNRKKQKK